MLISAGGGGGLSPVNDKCTNIFGQDCSSSQVNHAFTQIIKSKVFCQCLKTFFIFNITSCFRLFRISSSLFLCVCGWQLRPIDLMTAVAFRPAHDTVSSQKYLKSALY